MHLRVRADIMWAFMLLAVAACMVSPAARAEQASPADASAVAQDARVGGDLNRTRFVADLSSAVDFRAFVLSDPYRVIIDLPEVKFMMPSGVGSKGKGLISSFRFGQFAPGKSRIVIDTVEPVLIDKAFVRAAEANQPARLVVDLVRTTKAEFEAQRKSQMMIRQQAPRFATSTEAADDDRGNSPPQAKKNKPVIVLDPGHGGVDPGAISPNGSLEKNIVFAFCQTLKTRLEASGRYRVVLTRDDDVFIPLPERVERARKEHADLLLSVHADAMDLKRVTGAADIRGASIYTLSEEASDELAKTVAANENKVDILAGVEAAGAPDDDLAGILIDLMHRETKNLSVTFARQVLVNLKGNLEFASKPHRFANFKVLKAQDVPSVLLELGYLSQKEDEKSLLSDEWRLKVADAMVHAINTFFAKRQVNLPAQ